MNRFIFINYVNFIYLFWIYFYNNFNFYLLIVQSNSYDNWLNVKLIHRKLQKTKDLYVKFILNLIKEFQFIILFNYSKVNYC